MTSKSQNSIRGTGSLAGLALVIITGFLLYLFLSSVSGNSDMLPSYETLEQGIIDNNMIIKVIWMIKDFSEGQFFGGLFASIGVIIGGVIAWILDRRSSKYRGSDIVFGLNIFPWVLASQIITMIFSVFVLRYLTFIDGVTFHWVPTFLLIVGVAPTVLCIFGPSIKNLIIGCLLGSFTTVPIANFIGYNIIDKIGMPIAISHYFALALTILLALQACKILPFINRQGFPIIKDNMLNLSEEEKYQKLKSPKFIVSKTLTAFTDCLFYGNEWASIFLILGAMIDWMINSNHGMMGAGVFPAILFSQLMSGAIGAFLYGYKYIELGFYPTYVPIVSICPFCVLTFGPTLPVIIFSSIIGAIVGAPFADFLGRNLPTHIHGVIPNVLSMGITTMGVIAIMKGLPWF